MGSWRNPLSSYNTESPRNSVSAVSEHFNFLLDKFHSLPLSVPAALPRNKFHLYSFTECPLENSLQGHLLWYTFPDLSIFWHLIVNLGVSITLVFYIMWTRLLSFATILPYSLDFSTAIKASLCTLVADSRTHTSLGNYFLAENPLSRIFSLPFILSN